jgi:hypothetical protein
MAYALATGLQVSLSQANTTATYASGGGSGATSVVISTANANIAYGQALTGTGFAANTYVTGVSGTTVTFTPAAASQISGTLTFTSVWYKLTDHNRGEISITPTLIEKSQRMANGTMRKYVVDQKDTIATSWDFLPTKTAETVDGGYGAAWMAAFYEANSQMPIYLKVIKSQDTVPGLYTYPLDSTFASASTGFKIYTVFMTSFSMNILKRTTVSDYVNLQIEFTEQ